MKPKNLITRVSPGRAAGIAQALALALFLGAPSAASGFLTVNVDFNGPSATTESTRGGVLEPFHTFWRGIVPTAGTSFVPDTTFQAVGQLRLRIIQFSSSHNDDEPLYDGLAGTSAMPVRVDLESLVPGQAYTVVVYVGGAGNRVTVQGASKFTTGISKTLPGLANHDYLRFNGVRASAAGTISIRVGVIDSSFIPRLAGLQVSGPFFFSQPDAKIGTRPSALRGTGVYSRTGAGQTVSGQSRRGRTVRYHVEGTGFGGGPLALVVGGPRSDRTCRVTYFNTEAGRTNITGAVVAGTFSRSFATAADPMKLRIDARPSRRARNSGRTRRKVISLRVAAFALSFHIDRVRARLVIR